MLLNVDGRKSPGFDFPGEQAVPSDYRAFIPSSAIAAVRALAFGRNPDRLMLNYRTAQFMSVLHSTSLVDYVLALDSRITYNPADPGLYDESNFGVVIEGPAVLDVTGRHELDEGEGRLLHQWKVSLAASTASVYRETVPAGLEIHDFTVADGRTSDIPLDRSGLKCSGDPTPGNVWFITSKCRPSRSLSDVCDVLRASLGEPHLIRLFGAAPVEPYLTFQNLWRQHEMLPYRLGGLLLATIYRSHEIWVKGNG